MRTGLLGLAIGLALADSSIVTLALPEILGRVRRRRDDRRLGAHVLQPRARSLGATGRAPRASAARAGVRRRGGRFRGVVARLWPCRVVRAARRAPAAFRLSVRPSSSPPRSGSSRAPPRATRRRSRVWVRGGRPRRGARPGGGRDPDRDARLGVDLPRPGAARPRLAARSPRRVRSPRLLAPAGRPHLTANAALLLLSGGLVAALFLLVLLLVTGWGMSPAAAGLVVTVLPLAAIAAARLAPRSLGIGVRMASGVILVSGGLAGLAFLPRAGWEWTIAPQVLVGAGIGLALAALTERALAGRAAARRARRLDAGRATRRGRARAAPARARADVGARAEPRRSGARRAPPQCSTAGFPRSTSCASRKTCSTRWRRRRTGRASRCVRGFRGPAGRRRLPRRCGQRSRISSIARSPMRSRRPSCSRRQSRSAALVPVAISRGEAL